MQRNELLTLYSAGVRGFAGRDLSDIHLSGCQLPGLDLRGCSLAFADLKRANLRGGDLTNTNLFLADLHYADLRGATLPSLPALWQASWGTLPDALTLEAMRWDAVFHHDTTRFNQWVKTGHCPYARVPYQRAIHFRERHGLWKPGNPRMSAIAFTVALLDAAHVKHSLKRLL